MSAYTQFGYSYPSASQGSPYGLKEGAAAAAAANPGDVSAAAAAGVWAQNSGLTAHHAQTTAPPGYYPYDPTFAAAYSYGAGYDLATRRKNATRESTATLKAWLNEHKKNPYPTKGEKIMLAIITKMTLTQVSTWFANARRRLKKENKMTWEPKNRVDDEDDDDSSMVSSQDKPSTNVACFDKIKQEDDCDKDRLKDPNDPGRGIKRKIDDIGSSEGRLRADDPNVGVAAMTMHHPRKDEDEEEQKPKIWSLADTAICKNVHGQDHSMMAGGVIDHHQSGLCRNPSAGSHSGLPPSIGWGSQMGMGMSMGMNMGMNMGMGLPGIGQADLNGPAGHGGHPGDAGVSDCSSAPCYQFPRHSSPGDLYGKYSSLFGSIPPTTCQSYSGFMSRSSPTSLSCGSQPPPPDHPSMSSPYSSPLLGGPSSVIAPPSLAAPTGEPPTDTPPDTPPALKQRGAAANAAAANMQHFSGGYRPNGVPDSYQQQQQQPPPSSSEMLHSMNSCAKPMVDSSPDKGIQQSLGQQQSQHGAHQQHMQNAAYNQLGSTMVPQSNGADQLTAFRPVFKGGVTC